MESNTQFEEKDFLPSFFLNYIGNSQSNIFSKLKGNQIITNTSLVNKTARFIRKNDLEHGWLRVEYGMLPYSTNERIDRERNSFQTKPRTVEIERILSRALRSSLSMDSLSLSNRTIILDNDIILADGSTRALCLNSSLVSLYLFLKGNGLSHLVRSLVFGICIGIKEDGTFTANPDFSIDQSLSNDIFVIVDDKEKIVELHCNCDKNGFSIDLMKEIILLSLDSSKRYFDYLRKNIL